MEGLLIGFIVDIAPLQVVLADSSSAWQHRHPQQRHLSGRGTVHQPGSDSAQAAPRPGASEQQRVFGSEGGLDAGQLQAPPKDAADSSQAAVGTRPKVPLLAVTVMSAVMSLMSTLGVLPYFFCSKLSKPWAGVANAVASGVMLAASFGLLAEGAPYGGTYLILGMLLGVVFVKFCEEHLEQ